MCALPLITSTVEIITFHPVKQYEKNTRKLRGQKQNCSLDQSICRTGVIQVKNRTFMPHDDFHVVILSICVDYLTLTLQSANCGAVQVFEE